MKKWLNVIGIGEDGIHGLKNATKFILESADVIIGGKRPVSYTHLTLPTKA